jgi:hypothetical protein
VIDLRTRFFAVSAVIAASLIFVSPEDLKFVPAWTAIVYVILSLLSLFDHLARHR